MVWPTRNLIQSTSIVGSPPRTHTNTRSVRAKYLWPNMFLPTKMFSIPVYHIPESAPRMENWKQADLLMDLKCAGIHIPFLIHGVKVIFRYHLSNLRNDKTHKYKVKYNLYFSQFFDLNNIHPTVYFPYFTVWSLCNNISRAFWIVQHTAQEKQGRN